MRVYFPPHYRTALCTLLMVTTCSCSDQNAQGDVAIVEQTVQVPTMQEEPTTVVFLGDSHFAKQPLDAFFTEVEVVNSGVNGNTSQQVLDRVLQAVPGNASKVVIGVGINDLLLGGSVSEYATNMDSLLRTLHKERSNAGLIVLSIMPTADPIYETDINACNAILRSMCETYRCEYVDLYEPFVQGNVIQPSLVYDGLHLNKVGTEIWVEMIRTALMDRTYPNQ